MLKIFFLIIYVWQKIDKKIEMVKETRRFGETKKRDWRNGRKWIKWIKW